MIASASLRSDLHINSALESLTDTRSLKELFYDRLHYDRVSEPISTRRFSDSVRASLGNSEPLLWANGGVGGQFKVIYTRLSSQQIYKQEQRGIIESLLGIHPHSLFVFSNQAQDDWHFINAKYDESQSPNPLGKGANRRLLRRIVVNQREQLRTAIEQIGELDLQAIGQECGKKAGLEKKIENIKEQIATFTPGVYKAGDFDWMVDFAEIMADGGFDIQVANPPYVRMELFKEIKSTLKKNFPEAHSDRSDLYCYFYARSLQLLKPGGMLAYISSNKWFKAGYGAKLREYIAKACQIHSITDFGDLRIFKEASVSTAIFIGQRITESKLNVLFTQVKFSDLQTLNVKNIITQTGSILPHNAIIGESWLLTNNTTANRIKQMESASIPLGKYVNGEIYYGVKTGFNQAFSIDENIRVKLISENPASEEIIKPLLEGKDVGKWDIKYKDRYLLYMYHGIDIKKLDAVISYLKPYRQQLEKRATNQEWYELQQPQMKYSTAFDKPKIIYPDICQTSRFAFDDKGAFTRDTTFVIPTNDMYLLGVLNSTHIWKYLRDTCLDLGQSLRLKNIYMSKVPIPQASEIERKAISKLVQKCLDAKGVGCEVWEKEIDIRVAKLYRFDDNYDLN